MVVEDILSGDTVLLVSARPGPQVPKSGKVTARLLDIDAPDFGLNDECYAQEAQAKLESLLPEGTVAWVATTRIVKDELGRYLMYVWSADDRFVNYELTLGGYRARSGDGAERGALDRRSRARRRRRPVACAASGGTASRHSAHRGAHALGRVRRRIGMVREDPNRRRSHP